MLEPTIYLEKQESLAHRIMVFILMILAILFYPPLSALAEIMPSEEDYMKEHQAKTGHRMKETHHGFVCTHVDPVTQQRCSFNIDDRL